MAAAAAESGQSGPWGVAPLIVTPGDERRGRNILATRGADTGGGGDAVRGTPSSVSLAPLLADVLLSLFGFGTRFSPETR